MELMPHSHDTEQALLGSILLNNEVLPDVLEIITSPGQFYADSHKKIMAVIISLFQKNDPIDITTVADELENRGLLEECGGRTYLVELVNGVASTINAPHYSELVKDYSLRRQIVSLGGEFINIARSENDIGEIIEEVQRGAYDLSSDGGNKPIRYIGSCAVEYLDQIGRNEMTGIRTGYPDIDRWTGGLRGGNVYIIAADTGVGKTTFAMNIAENMATDDNPAVVFSLEMNTEELFHRLACSHAEINGAKVSAGELTFDESKCLVEAVNKVVHCPIIVIDDDNLTPMRMRSKLRKIRQKPSVVVVDYIQLLNPGTKWENETTRISHCSQAAKNMAKEFDVPMIVVSQLSRSSDHRGLKKRPTLASLRGSGSLEQDAYVVMFLYRDEGEDQKTDLIIDKNRGGKTGILSLIFRREYSRYENASTREDVSYAGRY
jgi:replicative DNA helicase